MKTVVNASIGGRSFSVDSDAYDRLNLYLSHFREKLGVNAGQSKEIMDELEGRIAEHFFEEVGDSRKVVSLPLVEKVIRQLGMPDGSDEQEPKTKEETYSSREKEYDYEQPRRRRALFRDPDNRVFGGVCAGVAAYFDLDLTLVRVITFCVIAFGGVGFCLYLILWLCVPKAVTAAEKCMMHGEEPTAENMAKYSYYRK